MCIVIRPALYNKKQKQNKKAMEACIFVFTISLFSFFFSYFFRPNLTAADFQTRRQQTDRHAHVNLQTQSVLSNIFLFNKNKPRKQLCEDKVTTVCRFECFDCRCKIIIKIIHNFSIALFPAEWAQRTCSHTLTYATYTWYIIITYLINYTNIKQVFVEQWTK